MSGRRGRRHNRIHGHGPVAEFARLLRSELTRAGTPSRSAQAKKGNYGASTMSLVDNGRTMPSWAQAEAYLKGCDVTGPDLDEWRESHAHHAALAARYSPDLDTAGDREGLLRLLQAMLRDVGVDIGTCADRAAAAARDGCPDFVPQPVPDGRDLIVSAEPGRLTEHALAWLVYTAGGALDDVGRWVERHRQLAVAAPPAPPAASAPLEAAAPPGPVVWPARVAAPRRRRRTRVAAGLAASVLLGLASAAALLAGGAPGGPGSPVVGNLASGSAPPTLEPRAEGAAGQRLLDLADRAERAGPAPAGRYRCVHRADWTVEATEADAPEVRTDERLCWANDAQGRRVVTVTRRGAAPATRAEELPPGAPRSAGPPSTDPAVLAVLVGGQRPKPDGHARALLLCIDLADSYPLDPQQSAAVLRMLAAQDGLVLRGQGVDRLGRPGLAVSADGARGKRVTLLFDGADGRLLGAQLAEPVPAAGAVNVEDIAYVESGWSDRLPQQ
ncbi:hypothetical protein [Dactylosporangium sp. NPDC051484]|uniref:hypothetical protein n=1 Tax=Dactylosporangium sp. NPDC051484 TaxID=3154942 RepID=UPI00344C88F8